MAPLYAQQQLHLLLLPSVVQAASWWAHAPVPVSSPPLSLQVTAQLYRLFWSSRPAVKRAHLNITLLQRCIHLVCSAAG